MTTEEILLRYKRGIATQKRRLIIRSIMTITILSTALLRYFDVMIFNDVLLIFYAALFVFFIYSYAIGRRIGASKDFRAIAEHYMQQDIQLDSQQLRNVNHHLS